EGNRQVGESHDEGETSSEIAHCLEVVFRAVPRSSRPDAKKLLYAIEMTLRDEYELTRGAEEVLDREGPREGWAEVADLLARGLQESPAASRDEDFYTSYRRDRLSGWLIDALQHAGREAEVIPLLEAEAPITGSYVRLVDALLAARRVEDAERWAVEGIEKVKAHLPGIAQDLRERLRGLMQRRKDWPAVAAMRAEEFFDQPSTHSLRALEKAARKA